MTSLRALFRDHRLLALLLLGLALAARALLPPGYMPGTTTGVGEKHLTIQLCTMGMDHRTAELVLPMVAPPSTPQAPPPADGTGHDGKTAPHCAFSSLAMGAMEAGAGPVAAFVPHLLALRASPPPAAAPPAPHPYLRPPLRGPPLPG